MKNQFKLRLLTGVFAAAAAFGFANASSAQDQVSPQRLPHGVDDIPNPTPERLRKDVENFGSCVVRREAALVEKLVYLPVGSVDYDDALDGVLANDGGCLFRGTPVLTDMEYRGALFIGLYRRDYKTQSSIAFEPQFSSGYRELYPVNLTEIERSWVSLVNFGECVSRANPDAVHAFVISRPGTSAEDQAIGHLKPQLSTCVVKGDEIRFSRGNLKGILAEGLYRLSRKVERTNRDQT